MTLIQETAGCKVGWAWYDDEAEATERAAAEDSLGRRKMARGYDFGYLTPGDVKHHDDHPEHGEVWVVTTA